MKRPALFATSLAITNFRGYGRFRLELPSEPCVVLLSGPNGLGKTSLFEAIEWTLTDSVRRLDVVAGSRADRRDLARRAAGVDSFEVELSFIDAEGKEEKITRTQLVPKTPSPASVGTKLATVAEFLRADDTKWNVSGENISSYLHLTHVHAQVAALRLVTSKSKERWLKVSPLAGAERFERVRVNLTSTKQALTKLKDRAAVQLAAVRDRQSRWEELLLRLAQARSLAAVVREALSPREITERILESARGLGVSVVHLLSTTDDVVAASEALRAFRDAVDGAKLADEDRLKTIARLRIVVRQCNDLRSQQGKHQARTATLDADVAAARTTSDVLAEATRQAREAHEIERRKLETAGQNHERLLQARQVLTDLQRVEGELQQSTVLFRAAEKSVEDSEVAHRRRVEDLAAHEKTAAEGDTQRRRLLLVDEGVAALAEMDALEKQLAVENDKKLILEAAIRTNTTSARSVADEREATQKSLAEAASELEALRQVAQSFQQALLSLAQHISDDDTQCPICNSAFEPSALKALAHEAVAKSDPRLASAEARGAALRTAQATLQKRETQLARERRKADADLRAVVEKATQITTRIDELRKKEPLNAITSGDYRSALARVREDATKHLARIDAALDSGRALDVLRQALVDAVAKVDAAKRARALEQERFTARQARVSELRARHAQLVEGGTIETNDDLLRRAIEVAAADVASARALSDAAGAKYAEAHASDAAARKTLAAAVDELARENAQRTGIEAGLSGAEKEWRGARLSPPISDVTLDLEEEQLGRRRGQFDATSAGFGHLTAALQRWQDAAELQRIEAQVRDEHGAIGRDEHTRALGAAVALATKELEDAERARLAADDLGATLQDVTAEFGERALKPFDELFRRYVRALIHDERFHNIEVAYESSARAAGMSFRVSFGGGATEAEFLLSEGQLGEVSLAAMLAASTAFPWSRWRALLLDDPTQYNDLIHATALYDVLRNLVHLAGYQVFISTHDNEQAAFFRRKLDAVGIKCVDCRFRAHTPDGIEVDVQSASESSN
ncbi:MAG TPA: AAA family ATPase [Kofleriaceae bacterium]|jgi:DNA repair exonuclease SbcCD ATPase subunit